MCGFIGIYAPDGEDVLPDIYEGLISVQHRGQDAAGIVTFDQTFHVKKGFGLVRDVFKEKNVVRLKGHLGVGHVRYPTVGTGTGEDAQPFLFRYPLGVAMAHNGNVTNMAELEGGFFKDRRLHMESSCDLEAILAVFTEAMSQSRDRGALAAAEEVFAAVASVFEMVKGAYSVAGVLSDEGLFAFRDPLGIKPCIVGVREDEGGQAWAVASESVALEINGFEAVRDLHAGEAVFIGPDREPVYKIIGTQSHRPCIFELVYFARPDSRLDDISVYATRVRFGETLAEQWRESGHPLPDVVMAVPDSARDAAVTMARTLGVPYREGLVKNRYIGRTFIMPSQAARKSSIHRKLNTIRAEFQGRRVCLVDDSIVRGNTGARIVQMARDAGAREVYMAITSPPLAHPCPYGIDMATRAELVAGHRDVEGVRQEIGADILVYLERDRMVSAAREGNPAIESFCTGCFTGSYPTGDVSEEMLAAIEDERVCSRATARGN